ncbi:MAG: hypothetical protein RLZ97_363 [Verrucomicrobiota bacterium]
MPKKYNWAALKKLKGAELEGHYIETLRELGTEKGMLGQIFTKAQNKIQDPAKLARLIAMVDETQWTTLEADVKGDIYEGILERNAEDTKSGAGQYFTPRALIAAMVECVAPEPGKTIADPACGTGSFFLSAYDYRTNIHHTLKRNPLRLEHLREFIGCYNPANRHKRKETWHAEKNPDGRWRRYSYAELAARDKTSLDLFWLKDDSLTDLDNLPEPADLAEEIIENIEAGLNSFRIVAASLQKR